MSAAPRPLPSLRSGRSPSSFTLGEEERRKALNSGYWHKHGLSLLHASHSTSSPCGKCNRGYWSQYALLGVSRRVSKGAHCTILWAYKSEPHTLYTWHGTFIGQLRQDGRRRIRYDEHSEVLYFPPNDNVVTLRLQIRSEKSLTWLRQRCARYGSVGSRVAFRFWSQGKQCRWTGTVVSKQDEHLLVMYDQMRNHPLLLPPPSTANITPINVFFWQNHSVVTEYSSRTFAATSKSVLDRGRRWPRAASCKKHNGLEKTLLTFNARSLKAPWRQKELDEFLQEHGVVVACVQETRWHSPDAFRFIKGHQILMKNASPRGIGGIAMLIAKHLDVEEIPSSSDSFHAAIVGQNLIIVNAYAPHAGKAQSVVGDWWDEFSKFVDVVEEKQQTLSHPTQLYIMGDFNAPAHGRFTLQHKGKNSRFLSDFACAHQLHIGNTLFAKPERRLKTFRDHRRSTQLDSVLLQQRWRSSLHDVYSTAAPVPSDHRPLLIKTRVHIKKQPRTLQYKPPKPTWTNLNVAERKVEFLAVLKDRLQNADGDTEYDKFQQAANAASEVLIDTTHEHRYLEALTNSIANIPLIHANFSLSKPTQQPGASSLRAIRDVFKKHEALKAHHEKEIEMEVLHHIKNFESLSQRFPRQAWKQIDELVGICSHEEVASRSTPEEIREHFSKVNGRKRAVGFDPPVFTRRVTTQLVKSGKFSIEELQLALKSLQTGRAVGRDSVPAELLRLPELQDIVLALSNEYYEGRVSKWLLETRLKLLPKKGDARFVANCRGIAIMSVFLKLVNRMLLNRLRVPKRETEGERECERSEQPERSSGTATLRYATLM